MGFDIKDGVLVRYTDEPGVTEVTVPEDVREIDSQAFMNCSTLRQVHLPAELLRIGNLAFFQCETLTEITIPAHVAEIGKYAFCKCGAMQQVRFLGRVRSICEGAFFSTPWLQAEREKNPLVIVDHCLIDGSTCTGEVTIPDDVTAMQDTAFRFASDITALTFPHPLLSYDGLALGKQPTLRAVNCCVKGVMLHLPGLEEWPRTAGYLEAYHCQDDRTLMLYLLYDNRLDSFIPLAEQTDILTPEMTDWLTEKATEYGKPECYAYLVDYKQRKFGFAENPLRL